MKRDSRAARAAPRAEYGGGGERDAAPERWGGSVRAGRGDGLVPARFAWLDRESGERLLVDFEGTESFFRELEALGFERQGREPGGEEELPGLQAERRAHLIVLPGREDARRPA